MSGPLPGSPRVIKFMLICWSVYVVLLVVGAFYLINVSQPTPTALESQ